MASPDSPVRVTPLSHVPWRALIPRCAWGLCLLCSGGAWLVAPSLASHGACACAKAMRGAWLVSLLTYVACTGSAVHPESLPLVQRGRVACLSLIPWCVCWFAGARGLSLPCPMVLRWFAGACGASATCAAGGHGLSLHVGSSVCVACLSLVPWSCAGSQVRVAPLPLVH